MTYPTPEELDEIAGEGTIFGKARLQSLAKRIIDWHNAKQAEELRKAITEVGTLCTHVPMKFDKSMLSCNCIAECRCVKNPAPAVSPDIHEALKAARDALKVANKWVPDDFIAAGIGQAIAKINAALGEK